MAASTVPHTGSLNLTFLVASLLVVTAAGRSLGGSGLGATQGEMGASVTGDKKEEESTSAVSDVAGAQLSPRGSLARILLGGSWVTAMTSTSSLTFAPSHSSLSTLSTLSTLSSTLSHTLTQAATFALAAPRSLAQRTALLSRRVNPRLLAERVRPRLLPERCYGRYYVVRNGDTCLKLFNQFYNKSSTRFTMYNRCACIEEKLYDGRALCVPN